jgi:hypothetical protein
VITNGSIVFQNFKIAAVGSHDGVGGIRYRAHRFAGFGVVEPGIVKFHIGFFQVDVDDVDAFVAFQNRIAPQPGIPKYPFGYFVHFAWSIRETLIHPSEQLLGRRAAQQQLEKQKKDTVFFHDQDCYFWKKSKKSGI